MKKWMLFMRDNKRQFLVVVVWRFFILSLIVLFGFAFIIKVGIENYMGLGIYTILLLLFVMGTKETYINIKIKLKQYEEPYIVLENLDN